MLEPTKPGTSVPPSPTEPTSPLKDGANPDADSSIDSDDDSEPREANR